MSLYELAREGNLAGVKEFFARGNTINSQNESALLGAAENGHLAVVQELLNRGPPGYIHLENDEALNVASSNDHLDLVRYILDRGLPFSDDVLNNIIWKPALLGHKDIVQELFYYGASLDKIPDIFRVQYQDLIIPRVISIRDYYQMEPSLEGIRDLFNRYIFKTKNGVYLIFKEVDFPDKH
jgi:hypothetical protein